MRKTTVLYGACYRSVSCMNAFRHVRRNKVRPNRWAEPECVSKRTWSASVVPVVRIEGEALPGAQTGTSRVTLRNRTEANRLRAIPTVRETALCNKHCVPWLERTSTRDPIRRSYGTPPGPPQKAGHSDQQRKLHLFAAT